MAREILETPLPTPTYSQPCKIWQGKLDSDGYGIDRGRGAHRRAYEAAKGSIPKGMCLDHLCRRRNCVEVAHLQVVTPWENTMRSPLTQGYINASKTHCIHGHEFSPENTSRGPAGRRRCKACRRAQSKERRVRIRAARERGDSDYRITQNGRPASRRSEVIDIRQTQRPDRAPTEGTSRAA